MFKWDTNKVVEALEKLPGVVKVKATGAGGDHDTTQILVYAKNCKDRLFVSGYPSTDKICENRDLADCPWVEITDGEDSSGGLNSHNKNLALVYVEVRDYFLNHGADVINHYDEIF